jgi:hypothetical protein
LDAPSLFNLDQEIRVGIEDFLWAAAVGGIASVVGELLLKERLATMRSQPLNRHYAPFAVIVVILSRSSFGIHTKPSTTPSLPSPSAPQSLLSFAAT